VSLFVTSNIIAKFLCIHMPLISTLEQPKFGSLYFKKFLLGVRFATKHLYSSFPPKTFDEY
jgi:hypothetical protein